MPPRWVGQPVKRIEDPALLTGNAHFVDDIRLPETAHLAFVRSPHPHALIRGIDGAAARALPSVLAVLTLADLRPHITADRLPLGFRTAALPDGITPFVLAKDEVSFVGEAVAAVVAKSRYIAEDAAARVAVDYEPLPPVADCVRAVEPGSPRARNTTKSNVLVEFRQDYGDAARAFAEAPRKFAARFRQHRGAAHPLEGRGALARWEAHDDRLTFWTSTQMSHEVRAGLVHMLDTDENRVRVVAPEVGGGFGCKFLLYSEEVVVAVAARMLGRPVKWIEDRREHCLSSIQERDQVWDMEIATDRDGRVLGVRGTMILDNGAYTPQGINLPYNASTAVPGPYVVPAYQLRVLVAGTNKVPAMPVRGAGYPEGTYAMERMLDVAAVGLGMDRAEIRRRNLIAAERLPYKTPLKTRSGSHVTPDSGDFHKSLAKALAIIDYDGFAARREAARREGRYLGIGVSNGIKGTGRGPFESGRVRVSRSGKVSVFTGAMPMGQGTKTSLAQLCAEQLGVDVRDITVTAGDTATIDLGQGGFASRQAVTAGSSVHLAAVEVRKKILLIAAHTLEAAEEDLEIEDGRVRVKGAANLSVAVRDIAEGAAGVPGYSMPGGIPPGLDAEANFMPPALTYSNSTHAVEVEVDIETGGVEIRRYIVVSDCGRRINPMIVDGQVQGGAAHGIGNALYEWAGYDDGAQPVATTLADYIMPTAPEVPNFELAYIESPSPLNPIGVKGVGECGTVPAAAAIVSAVENALAPFGLTLGDYPLKPGELVEKIGAARPRSPAA
jgi:carbon-monoxide dehydrogenase large subunit